MELEGTHFLGSRLGLQSCHRPRERRGKSSAMCGADEDKADQGYDAILDRDGDVGRFDMRIAIQLGLSVALDVLSDFIFFSRDPCDARAGGFDQQREPTVTDLDADRPRRLDDRQILHFSGLRRSGVSVCPRRPAVRRQGPTGGAVLRLARSARPPKGDLLKPVSPARQGVRLNWLAHSIGNVARLGPRGKAASI